ncbi:MAG: hypothetical protein ABIF82_13355 [Planctomycetota bacterium]
MKARTVLVAAMTVLCSLGAPPLAAEDADKLEVVADEAKIVVGDKVLATVKKGDRLTRVRWVAVELARDGKVIPGWIRADQVAVAGKPKAPLVPRAVEAARGNTKIQGTWHRYGSIGLGVMADGQILALQIFGPDWRNEQKGWEGGRK